MRCFRYAPWAMLLFCLACSGGGGGSSSSTSPDTPAPTDTTPVTEQPQATPDPTPVADLDTPLRAALNAAGVVPLTTPPQDAHQVVLGQALMFDKILSGNKDMACATCHHPDFQTGDALSLSIGTGGHGLGPLRTLGTGKTFIPRNAPPLFNLNGVNTLFWDGRIQGTQTPAGAQTPPGLSGALAAQALFPVTDRDEMRGQAGDTAVDGSPNELAPLADNDFTGIWAGVVNRLTAIPQYVIMFQNANPGLDPANIRIQHVANAIAAFEIDQGGRHDSPFDRYVAGDNAALSDAQKRGASLFYGQARCAQCHRGGLLSDFQFHDVAFPQVGPGKGAEAPLDLGRGRETGQAQDRFRFRTAPLRNVARTGPWTHAGGYTTLENVVRHYINPGQALQNYDPGQLDPRLQGQVHVQDAIAAGVLNNLDPILRQPNPLSPQDVSDLVAFLNALTDDNPVAGPPASVPSGLPVDP